MMTVDIGAMPLQDSRYEFPKDLRRRKLVSYIVIPVLFYSPLLVAWVGSYGVDGGLLLMMGLFLTIFVGLLFVLVHLQRPLVEIDPLEMRVEGRTFQVRHLASMSLSIKGRAGLEPIEYMVAFEVVEPGVSTNQYRTHPIRSIKDADALVRDLKRLLPDVPFHDRTPLGKAFAAHERYEEPSKTS